ncbi:hypothetical protein Hamer_G025977 [Homarus americanus]|uniref:Uncharacterized protein n=1 Tax=Homarus americanus TaxID=6706 RepID=A0A8J5NE47_HOMAM|nr:hypothetical protein Hamer_G025977 [Homarus americanus]
MKEMMATLRNCSSITLFKKVIVVMMLAVVMFSVLHNEQSNAVGPKQEVAIRALGPLQGRPEDSRLTETILPPTTIFTTL